MRFVCLILAFTSLAAAGNERLVDLSWVGRRALAAHNYSAAEANARQVRTLCLAQLSHRPLDAEPNLPTALGASIEVQAQAATMQGRRDEAVLFLKAEEQRWHNTSIRARIQKNLNLLTLEGKPAPPIDAAKPLSAYRGHPVLLFFWAHWCSDCKAEAPIIRQLQKSYGPRGLVVIAPTQHYGYIAGGKEASRAIETKYIQTVFATYYSGLGKIDMPMSEETFARYGVSTTPTLVLVDANGIVRLYNPGALDYGTLSAKLSQLIR